MSDPTAVELTASERLPEGQLQLALEMLEQEITKGEEQAEKQDPEAIHSVNRDFIELSGKKGKTPGQNSRYR